MCGILKLSLTVDIAKCRDLEEAGVKETLLDKLKKTKQKKQIPVLGLEASSKR